MWLKREERNAILEVIEARSDFEPRDFDFAVGEGSAKLSHLQSNAVFEFSLDYDEDWDIEWVAGQPGEEVTDDTYQPEFDGLLESVGEWLTAIAADRQVPDRWAELEQERRAFSAGALGEGENNALFTPDEQRQITGVLKELTAHAQETYGLSPQEAHELKARLDYLADAAKRVGRVDWRNLMAGTLASAVAGAYLPTDAVRGVVGALASSVGHLLGVSVPQLPA